MKFNKCNICISFNTMVSKVFFTIEEVLRLHVVMNEVKDFNKLCFVNESNQI